MLIKRRGKSIFVCPGRKEPMRGWIGTGVRGEHIYKLEKLLPSAYRNIEVRIYLVSSSWKTSKTRIILHKYYDA